LFGISSITLVVLVEGDGDYTRLWLLLWLRLWLLLWLLLVFENRLRLWLLLGFENRLRLWLLLGFGYRRLWLLLVYENRRLWLPWLLFFGFLQGSSSERHGMINFLFFAERILWICALEVGSRGCLNREKGVLVSRN
jgi:hypothetical protein